jgi:hypothetical protein
MNLNPEVITSSWLNTNVGKGDSAVHVQIRYHILNNEFWYSYQDLCKQVGLNENIAHTWLNRDIAESDKIVFEDRNNYDKHGIQHTTPMDFVTSEVAHMIVKQHSDYVTARDKNILKAINNLEYRCDENYDELKEMSDLIINSFNKCDYEEAICQCYDFINTDCARNVLEQRDKIVKEKEELLDMIRYELYDDDYEEIIMKPKSNNETKVFKKRHKYNGESTCPSWIRNIVK